MSRRGPYRTAIPKKSSQAGPPPCTQEDRMIEAMDDLAEFDQFKAEILPKIRKQLSANAPTKDILNTARAVAVGRLAMIAALENDSKTALTAIKELLERTDGKVLEKKEITHAMANLKDDDLDALLITAVSDSDDDDN